MTGAENRDGAHTSVLLGCRGKNPRVEAYVPAVGDCEEVIRLSNGQSVYAIDTAPDGSWFVAGTRAGNVYRRLRASGTEPAHGPSCSSVLRATPVLDLCVVNHQLIAVAENGGICRLISPTKGEVGRLDCDGETVCSLLAWSDREAVGLAVSGSLVFWDVESCELTRRVATLVPPRPWARTRLVRSIEGDVLGHAGTAGMLALHDVAQNRMMTHQAHEGEFYAVMSTQGGVATIGTMDGVLRHWRGVSGGTVAEVVVGPGVVAATPLDADLTEILLVSHQGAAAHCRLEGGQAELVRELPGSDYSSVSLLAPHVLTAATRERNRRRAEELLSDASERIEFDHDASIENVCSELRELEHTHFAVALHVQQAKQRGDLVAELAHFRELLKALPYTGAGQCDCLAEYGAALERAWQPDSAAGVYADILRLDPAHSCRSRLEYVRERQAELEGKTPIMLSGQEPQQDLPVLIKAATAVGVGFTGKWVALRQKPCGGDHLVTPDGFVGKWHATKAGAAGTGNVWAGEVFLLQQDSVHRRAAAAIECGRCVSGTLWSCLLFRMGNAGGSVEPVVVWDFQLDSESTTPEKHNAAILEAVAELHEGTPMWRGLQQVYAAITETLNRVTTDRARQSHRMLTGDNGDRASRFFLADGAGDSRCLRESAKENVPPGAGNG